VLSDGLGRDVDNFTGRRRGRDGLPIFFESLQVELNGFMNQSQNFVAGVAHGDAPWKIWHIRAVRGGAFFYDYQISHLALLFLQTGLLQCTVEGTRRYIHARLSRDGDSARFVAMVILTVASLYPDLEPAIGFK